MSVHSAYPQFIHKPQPYEMGERIQKACVLGSGAFGTALSTVLARLPSTPSVTVWHMDQGEADMINKKHENVFFLGGCPLPHNITFSADVGRSIEDADIILIAIPTQFIRKFIEKHIQIFVDFFKKRPQVPIVVGTKGIEESTLSFPTEIILDVFEKSHVAFDANNMAVLAGPNFAAEIAKGKFSCACVAARDITTARRVQSLMSYPSPSCSFRLYASTDVVGCEVASAVKNVIAIAAGAIKGMGHMLNSRAALICRGLAELTGLVHQLGGSGQALQGLAGVGDMLLTCSSENSRNFTVGLRLGQGEAVEKILANPRAVAEGVATSRALHALVRKINYKMPICDAVYKVLYKKGDAHQLFDRILSQPLQDEVQYLPTNTHLNTGVSKL